MPKQFTFKSYVPKSAPEAKHRAVDTKLPTRTNTSGKTSTPGDSVDAPSRAVLQYEINAPDLGVDEFVRSGSLSEEPIALRTFSAVLDKELQPREVEHSVPRAQTEDFEDWLRQDKPSPEQLKNKRIQQPTPEYDDNDTEAARRKRPCLAREFCQNTLVDSGTTAGAHQKEGAAESDVERQATVQKLASPINSSHLSKDRCISPTPRTRPNNGASQGHDDKRFIERPAYACTTQTLPLISALARPPAPLPRNGLNLEAPTCSRCAPTGSCTISGHQSAGQKSALVERPVATQTQRSSWDQRAADLDQKAADLANRAATMDQQAADLANRAATMDQQAADLANRAATMDQRATDLAKRAASMDQRATDLDQQAADLANRAATMDQRATDLDQQAADLANRAATMDQRATDLDQQAADLAKRAASLNQRVADLDRRAADLDQRAASMDQRVADLDQQALDMDGLAAEVWERPADLNQRSADLEERDEEHDQRVADTHQQARAPSRQPSRASNQTVARQPRDIYADGSFDDDDDFASEDGASVCGTEDDAGHRLEAAHFSRGRLSQTQKLDLINWRNEGKPVEWIARQLNRRKENIAKLEEDARKSLG